MKLTNNTIFITGGGTGIGRGLAEALHKLRKQSNHLRPSQRTSRRDNQSESGNGFGRAGAGAWGKRGSTSVDLAAANVALVRAALDAASKNTSRKTKNA